MTRTEYIDKRKKLVSRLDELDEVIHEIAVNGYASASLSAGGGSKSYTRIDINTQLMPLRSSYLEQIAAIDRILSNARPGGIQHVSIVRC